jgi:hypothetical protein
MLKSDGNYERFTNGEEPFVAQLQLLEDLAKA